MSLARTMFSIFWKKLKNEEVVIIASSIVPVEVLKLKGQKPIAQKDQSKIRQFFQKDYFRWVDLSKKVGEIAQDLIWKPQSLAERCDSFGFRN